MAIQYLTVNHLNLKQIQRIFSKITLGETFQNVPCWIWNANHRSYRCIKWQEHTEKVHRLLYAWLVHSLPRGYKYGEIDHLCRNKSCVNPVHLEFVPRRINILRGNGPTAINAAKTYCAKGHLLTPRPSNPASRICSVCHLEKCRQNYHRKMTNTDFVAKERARMKARSQSLEYKQYHKERAIKRKTDPLLANQDKERRRQREQNRLNDPTYRILYYARKREERRKRKERLAST